MKAILVPSLTEHNKGDQALVWESHRLISDTALFDEIKVIAEIDGKDNYKKKYSQSVGRHFDLLPNIMPHPRRGHNVKGEDIKESKLHFAKQVITALGDLLTTSLLLMVCKNQRITRFIFGEKTYNTVKQFSESDAVFVKGGGFIHAYGEITAPYLMWYFLFYIRLAHRLKVKTVFLPNSFGPFEGITVKSQVKSVLGKMDLIFAREQISSDKLTELLETAVKVEKDLGFHLPPASTLRIDKLLKEYNLEEKQCIGITIRPWRFPGHSNSEVLFQRYLDRMQSLVKHILSIGYTPVFCNQSLGPNEHEDDRNAIREIMKRFVPSSGVIWVDENLPCDELKALYSTFYAFVGTRFHSVIFAITSGVPSIAIGYGGNKAFGIMSDLGLNDYVISIDRIENETLSNLFDKLLVNHHQIKERLLEEQIKINQSRSNIIESIKTLFLREP